MNRYKVSVIHLGYIEVDAPDEEKAREKALHTPIDLIHWLSEKEGLPGPFLITFVENTTSPGG